MNANPDTAREYGLIENTYELSTGWGTGLGALPLTKPMG